ncbi:DUF1194 domain-containing protein [Roseomonas sp. SSH11]|uniref:DUF1194 domain-containing protein n=1 Tax=Pararoseomonas baculiformis TaxID=2820812 RepID=A0ABS4AB89_9PROT|nr:DUF1194 domain-containing protein [Pararoseomonas baculiformis]MBP0444276.1 DUF1194 domain-containing protein [Pararoseomonas baculiformis]
MRDVDIALCLAVDASSSVDHDEFGLMMGGLAEAFRHPAVTEAAMAGPRGAAAVAVLLWSGPGAQEVVVPWTLLADAEGAVALAEAVDSAPRLVPAGATALGEGLAAALKLLAGFPADAAREVVDLSGDGAGNAGVASAPVRDAAVAAGVVINALAVVNEEPDLTAHYAAEVIGGPGAFVMECRDYTDFAEAIRRKLLREIRGALTA